MSRDLHIGHYFGALETGSVSKPIPTTIASISSPTGTPLTSDYADASAVAQNTIEITTDYLAAGLNPDKSVIFQQSLVREHAELHLLLSMVTPLGWLERVPTYKEALENVKDKDLHTFGFLGYPCLQTADIVIYSAANTDLFVPVGEDQVSHVELSREIVRRLNNYWGRNLRQDAFAEKKKAAMRVVADVLGSELVPSQGTPYTTEQKAYLTQHIRNNVREVGFDNFAYPNELRELIEADVLVEPQVMLTQTPRIPGLDGRKMSKSYGNAITLSESNADIRAKTKVMVTDPARKRRTDPGNPDVCPVYDWHKLFSPPPTLAWAANGCRTAGIGCIECKSAMADNLIKWIEPIRERRIEHEKNPARVLKILNEGSAKARDQAQKTMSRVREAVFGWDSRRKEIFDAPGE